MVMLMGMVWEKVLGVNDDVHTRVHAHDYVPVPVPVHVHVHVPCSSVSWTKDNDTVSRMLE